MGEPCGYRKAKALGGGEEYHGEGSRRSQVRWGGSHESLVDFGTGPMVSGSNYQNVIANHLLGCSGHLWCKTPMFCLQNKLKVL